LNKGSVLRGLEGGGEVMFRGGGGSTWGVGGIFEGGGAGGANGRGKKIAGLGAKMKGGAGPEG